jgi:hypothetical protein
MTITVVTKAYLICLWGSSMEYILGAMVLGASIRKTGSKHDRLCLFTEDVPREAWRNSISIHINSI